ncbi:hypothetical protein ACQJBY_007203 [Aegilops geniculata]
MWSLATLPSPHSADEMLGSETSSLLHGPVAFKDADDGTIPVHPPTEYAAAVASLPTNQNHASNSKLKRRCYQGVWVREEWAPGIMAMQRSFAARPGDVVLASVPKSGTTWLKALTFATMARAACPPASPAHPLRRLNPHDCGLSWTGSSPSAATLCWTHCPRRGSCARTCRCRCCRRPSPEDPTAKSSTFAGMGWWETG